MERENKSCWHPLKARDSQISPEASSTPIPSNDMSQYISVLCKSAWFVFLSQLRVSTNVCSLPNNQFDQPLVSDLLHSCTCQKEIYIPLALESDGMLKKFRFFDCTPNFFIRTIKARLRNLMLVKLLLVILCTLVITLDINSDQPVFIRLTGEFSKEQLF